MAGIPEAGNVTWRRRWDTWEMRVDVRQTPSKPWAIHRAQTSHDEAIAAI